MVAVLVALGPSVLVIVLIRIVHAMREIIRIAYSSMKMDIFWKVVRKTNATEILFGMLLMIVGIFGLSYTWHIDHRTADSLSAYARIDFQSSYTETGKLEGAVLSLWDYRYDNSKLLPKAILYTDGDAWEMPATVKQTSPGIDPEHRFMNENKLFVELPRSSLPAVKKAEEVRFRFYYDNGQVIDLPLNAPDLAYWKDQL